MVSFIWGQFSKEILQPLITEISLKIIFLKFHSNLSAGELILCRGRHFTQRVNEYVSITVISMA